MAMKQADSHLRKESRRNETVLSFFLYGQGVDLQKTRLGLYRVLLYQLYQTFPEAFQELTKRFEEHQPQSGLFFWTVEEVWRFLLEGLPVVCQKTQTVLLIDALDEAGESEAMMIVGDLTTLMAASIRLRICFSCRHYPNIDLKGGRVLVVEHSNSSDIELVVKQTLRSSTCLSDPERSYIEEVVRKRSQGVFQWVVLVLQQAIEAKLHGDSEALRQAIDNVPESLYSLYASLLQKPDPPKRSHRAKQRQRLLCWLWQAGRPLRTREIQHALAFDHQSGHRSMSDYSRGKDFINFQDIRASVLSLSRGLAHVKQFRVSFVHESVKDFLSDEGMQLLLRPAEGETVAGVANFHISRSCLTYLRMSEVREQLGDPNLAGINDFERHPESRSAVEMKRRFPLLSYAWEYWVYHTCRTDGAIKGDDTEVQENINLLEIFDWPDDETFLAPWVHIRDFLGYPLFQLPLDRRIIGDEVKSGDPLRWPNPGSGMIHLLAICGFTKTLQWMGSSSKSSSLFRNRTNTYGTPDAQGATPLEYSVRGHQYQTAQYLVKAEAGHSTSRLMRVLAGRGSNQTESRKRMLFRAVARDDIEAISVLTRIGVDVNARSKTSYGYLTPLSYAVTDPFYHTETVTALIAAGANVNVKDAIGNTPLHCAMNRSSEKYDSGVDDLLRNGADPNAANASGRTPLHFALRAKSTELVISYGGNVNARDSRGLTPLHSAITRLNKSFPIVKVLLEAGAAVNMKSKNGKGVMHCLLETERDYRPEWDVERVAILRLLLQNDLKLNISNGQKTALDSTLNNDDYGSSWRGIIEILRDL